MQQNKIERMLKKTIEFKEALINLKLEDLIVLDESGCYLNMTLPYARAEGGQRIKLPKKFTRGDKISIIGAISVNQVEAALYGEWNTNSEIFEAFIENKLLPVLSPGKVVIMDNVNFHNSKKIQELVESRGATILFLPPYTPEHSPIENMWSKIKQILKTESPKTIKEFARSIKKAFLSIASSDLYGWFAHCGYC